MPDPVPLRELPSHRQPAQGTKERADLEKAWRDHINKHQCDVCGLRAADAAKLQEHKAVIHGA